MYGKGPSNNEIEVSLFGPGYGEAIAVHLGDGRWMLVDSCINSDVAEPASLYYLSAIGVDPSMVRVVVATHWHDDHVRGISALAKTYSAATFWISGVFNDKEAMAFLSAYAGRVNAGQSSGTKELCALIEAAPAARFAYQRMVIHEEAFNGRTARVTAFSPTAGAQKQALAHLANYIPSLGEPINHAPELSPNVEAVVLHIDFGQDAVLLGSDLENYKTFGWQEIVDDSYCASRRRASLFKVGHHGSSTADMPRIWSDLLVGGPTSSLTPYNNGRVRLPQATDKKRIKAASHRAFLSSNATTRPAISHALRLRMSDICKNLRRRQPSMGVVRLRKKLSATSWQVELFGRAIEL